MVSGMQLSVTADVKHFLGNEQELYRNPITNDDNVTIPALNSIISDYDLHELYMWPFADTLYAGAGSVMGAYQQVNGQYACENGPLLNGLLKDELNFPGFVVSDWGAQYTGWPSAAAGLDVAMPNSEGKWSDGNLERSVRNGTLPESRLRDMGRRILASWFYVNFDEVDGEPGFGLADDGYNMPHDSVEARDPAAKASIYQAALEGHVLVKNDGALPLKTPKILNLFGYDATLPPVFMPNPSGFNDWNFGTAALELNISDDGLRGMLFQEVRYPQAASQGTLWVGGGSGGNTPPYVSTVSYQHMPSARTGPLLIISSHSLPSLPRLRSMAHFWSGTSMRLRPTRSSMQTLTPALYSSTTLHLKATTVKALPILPRMSLSTTSQPTAAIPSSLSIMQASALWILRITLTSLPS